MTLKQILIFIILIISPAFGKSKDVKADAGRDIRVPNKTTILLDASNSKPKKELKHYEWSFKEEIIFKGDYVLHETDSVIFHEPKKGTNDRVSIKKIITKNKFIELTVPDLPVGEKFPVVLKVVDNKGNDDSDIAWIKIIDPTELNENYNFTNVVLEEGDGWMETTAYKRPDVKIWQEYLIRTHKMYRVRVDGKFGPQTAKATWKIFRPNKTEKQPEIVKVTHDMFMLALAESLEGDRELDLYSKINPNFISIQPIKKSRLKAMEVEIINAFLYKEIQKLGIEKVLDPNRFIPDSIRTLKLVDRVIINADTSITSEKKYSKYGDDLSKPTIVILDTIITKDTVIAYEEYGASITIDTLSFSETIDTVLYYNFNCITDSCAAENAILEGVGQVLTWGINEYSELEIHFFKALNQLRKKPPWVWTSSPVTLDPNILENFHYPDALAVTNDGGLLAVAGNDQTVYKLNLNQDASVILQNKVLGKMLLHPSGMDVGPNGIVYITDRDNHRMFSKLDDEYVSILSAGKNKIRNLSNDQISYPSKVAIGPTGSIYVLYEGSDCVIKLNQNYDISIVLKPGRIAGIRDIAVSKNDTLFIASPSTNRVYKVINDSTAIPFAGIEGSSDMVKNNIPATESFLGSPVAIDFDNVGRLYIADNKFGLLRRVDKEGNITTLIGINNKIEGIGNMRVSKDPNPNIFISQPLKHKIQRISLNRVYPWRTEIKINSPYHIINKSGVYGLEPELQSALAAVLSGKWTLPKDEKTIGRQLAKNYRFISDYMVKHPLIFALLLILLNQSISSNEGGVSIFDLPPDFPNI